MKIKQLGFIKKLTQLPVVREIWLLGSRARGDASDRADIDLAKDAFMSLGDTIQRLKEVLSHEERALLDIMRDASIQRFEFVIELYWKVLKKILAYEKIDAMTPRDVVSKAYQFKLIDDESVWLAMLDDRNKTAHVLYNEDETIIVFEHIKRYLPVLEKSFLTLKKKYKL